MQNVQVKDAGQTMPDHLNGKYWLCNGCAQIRYDLVHASGRCDVTAAMRCSGTHPSQRQC